MNNKEVITVRLTPRQRFGLELLSRQQHRTISSVIEFLLNGAFEAGTDFNLDEIWDVDEEDRFTKLALAHPNLLDFDGQKRWKEQRRENSGE